MVERMTVTPDQMMQKWADMNDKLQEQLDKQDDLLERQGQIIDRLGNELSTKDETAETRLQAIEDRLDEPIDTKLTGSNVELIDDFEAYEVSGGGSSHLYGLITNYLDVSDFSYFSVGVRANSGHDFDIHIYWYGENLGNGGRISRSETILEDDNDRGVSDEVSIQTPYVQIYVSNNGDSDYNYDVMIWGRR